jgi:hypothetical protein
MIHPLQFCSKVPFDATSSEFARNIHIVWALSRGLNEDDAKFATFVNVDTIIPQVFAQKNSWECDQ